MSLSGAHTPDEDLHLIPTDQLCCSSLQPGHPHAFACFGLTDRTRRMMLEKDGQSQLSKKSLDT